MFAVDENSAPSRRWTVEGFEFFWSRARDPAMVAPVIWPDIIGRWPCATGPVAGRKAYLTAISSFLAALPEFTVEITDHAINGNSAFVRWIVSGTFAEGPNQIIGVDRLILKDGYVLENHIHSDHPIFARLAETRALG